MEISLIRHGRSKLIDNKKITGLEFIKWVNRYDQMGVFPEHDYPDETKKKISDAKIVVTSDLKRAIESAKLLNSNVTLISNSLFRETELPTPPSLWNIKLRPNIWAVLMRILWFSGFSKNCESMANARKRAEKAAQQLIDYAKDHHSVALVGHGFFNRLIAKELEKQGWKTSRKMSSKHWSVTTFRWKKFV